MVKVELKRAGRYSTLDMLYIKGTVYAVSSKKAEELLAKTTDEGVHYFAEVEDVVVEPEPEEIAEAIRKYFDDNKEEVFTANVKIEKKKYSWENFLEAIDKLAESIKTQG